MPTQAAQLRVEVRSEGGQPLHDAVVYLESADAKRRSAPLPAAEISQQQRQFVPRVLVVPLRTPVSFPNLDTVRHHVYSFSPIKKFEIKLYVGRPAEPIVFEQAGVAVLGCNIHDQMAAWVVVVETPYFGKTATDGTVTLDNVPPGTYQLRGWHANMAVSQAATSQSVTLGEGGASVKLSLPATAP